LDKTGSAALYFRGPEEHYSSGRCVIQAFSVDANPQDLTFHVPEIPHGIEAVRLNLLVKEPGDRIAYIKLYSLNVEVMDKKTNEMASLLTLHTDAAIRECCMLHGLVFNNKILGDLYTVGDNDPSIEFRIPDSPVAGLQAALVTRVSLEYLPGDGYILARNQFLVKQEQMTHRIRSLESHVSELEKIKEEFEGYRLSPLWGKFVRAREYRDKWIQWKRDGTLHACLKLFQPAWWSRLKLTGYERWRELNGYRNRNEK
jgi:hypothetical protein